MKLTCFKEANKAFATFIIPLVIASNADAATLNQQINTSNGGVPAVYATVPAGTYLKTFGNYSTLVAAQPIARSETMLAGTFTPDSAFSFISYSAQITGATPFQYVPVLFDARLALTSSLIASPTGVYRYAQTLTYAQVEFDSAPKNGNPSQEVVHAEILMQENFNEVSGVSTASTTVALKAGDAIGGPFANWISLDSGDNFHLKQALLGADPNAIWTETFPGGVGRSMDATVAGQYMAKADINGVARFTIRLGSGILTSGQGAAILTSFADPHLFLSPDYLAQNPTSQLSLESGWSNLSPVPESTSLSMFLFGTFLLLMWILKIKKTTGVLRSTRLATWCTHPESR